jgi:PIN domain nuclease of toxin-antitoxin system
MIALLDTHILLWWFQRVIAREVINLPLTRAWDPADRVLVASARVLGVPLVTSDTRIIESGLVKTIH